MTARFYARRGYAPWAVIAEVPGFNITVALAFARKRYGWGVYVSTNNKPAISTVRQGWST
jgi:hypothetical protein